MEAKESTLRSMEARVHVNQLDLDPTPDPRQSTHLGLSLFTMDLAVETVGLLIAAYISSHF